MADRRRIRADQLSRRKPLLVIDVPEDLVHQLLVGDTAVPGRVANHRDQLVVVGIGGKPDRLCKGVPPGRGDLDERQIRSVGILDVQDAVQPERPVPRASYFFQEVDRGIHQATLDSLPEHEGRAVVAPELGRHVAVRNYNIRPHQPASAEPGQAVSLDLDATDGARGVHQVP